MGAIEGKVFKSGNSLAVRLPREVAFPEGSKVIFEKNGDVLTIRPAKDPVEERRKVVEFVKELRALHAAYPVGEVEERDADIFPDRPGLY